MKNKNLLKKRALLTNKQALKAIHFPSSLEELSSAHRRLVYEEFLLMTTALNLKARETIKVEKSYKYTLHLYQIDGNEKKLKVIDFEPTKIKGTVCICPNEFFEGFFITR